MRAHRSIKMETIRKSDESQWIFSTRQLLATLSPLLAAFLIGLTNGFHTILLTQLIPTSTTDTNNHEIWITSNDDWYQSPFSGAVFAILGCYLSGIAMEKLGRKKSTMVIFQISLIGWIVIGFARNILYIKIGTTICSLSVGLFSPLIPVYIGEITDPSLRSLFLSMINTIMTAGVLMAVTVGSFLHWRIVNYICEACLLICWSTCVISHESPIWLMNRNRKKEALYHWVHFRGWKSEGEYRAMETAVRRNVEQRKFVGSTIISRLKYDLCSKDFLWPLSVSCMLFFVHCFSGYKLVKYHMLDIIPTTVQSIISTTVQSRSLVAEIIITSIIFVTDIVACFFVWKCNRRTLAIISAMGTISSLFVLILYVYLNLEVSWLIITCCLCYYVFFGIGLIHLPWIYCGELFPSKLRSSGSSIVLGFSYICSVVDAILAPESIIPLEMQELCIIYFTLMLVGSSFLAWKLPETKDKTLLEIERMFDDESGDNNVNVNVMMI